MLQKKRTDDKLDSTAKWNMYKQERFYGVNAQEV